MLLTVGDSFTVKRYEGDKPWGYCLAEMLGKRHFNVAQEGMSNYYIFRNTIWALNAYPEIDMVVLALTNWDRWELPRSNYGTEPNVSGIGVRTKTFKPKHSYEDATKVKLDGKLVDGFAQLYLEYYNNLFYVDQTAAQILAIHEICKSRGIPLIVTQPLLPFNMRIQKITNGKMDFLYMETNNKIGLEYIKETSLLNYVDKEVWHELTPTPKMIMFGQDFEVKEQQMFNRFTRRNPENCLGYHNKKIFKDRKDFSKIWDGHPSLHGHMVMAESIYERCKELI